MATQRGTAVVEGNNEERSARAGREQEPLGGPAIQRSHEEGLWRGHPLEWKNAATAYERCLNQAKYFLHQANQANDQAKPISSPGKLWQACSIAPLDFAEVAIPPLGGMKTKKSANNLPAYIAGLTPMELARKIPVADAAAHHYRTVEAFQENYPHLVVRVGKRRDFFTVYDAIMLPPPDIG